MFRTIYLAGLAAAVMTSVASAAVDQFNVDWLDTSAVAALDGYRSQDLVIDFTGQWTGAQLQVELTRGSIYQDTFGDNDPPNPAFFGSQPALEFDTFVMAGNLTNDVSLFGGAVDIWEHRNPDAPQGQDAPADLVLDSTGIYASWFGQPGNSGSYTDQADFATARITLTDDATGDWWYLDSVDGSFTVTTGEIRGGRMFIGEAPLRGDYNRDGQLSQADYTVWADAMIFGGYEQNADGNLDGQISQADYTVWADAMIAASGMGTMSFGGGATTAPEPASLLLLSLGAAVIVRRRRVT
jgi:hypothetical protein